MYSHVVSNTQTQVCTHLQTHILLTQPVMDDEGPVRGIDGPTPGIGELGIDGQDDVQLSRREPTLAWGHYSAKPFCLLYSAPTCLQHNINRT